MVKKSRVLKFILGAVIGICLAIAAFGLDKGSQKTAYASLEDEITYKKMMVGDYFNTWEGVLYHITLPPDTIAFDYEFDMEQSVLDGEYQYGEELTKEEEHYPAHFRYVENEEGKKIVSILFRRNGYFTINATLEKFAGEEPITSTAEFDIGYIDLKAPELNNNKGFWEKSIDGYRYYFYAEDPLYTQEKTSTSGLRAVLAFFDPLSRDTQEWELPNIVDTDDIKEVEDLEILNEWEGISHFSRKYYLSESFNVTANGDYYIFMIDMVGNSSIIKVLSVSDMPEYIYDLAGNKIDYTALITAALGQIARGESTHNAQIVDNLRDAVDNFEFTLRTGQPREVQLEAFRNVGRAQEIYNMAKITFNIKYINEELMPGKVEIVGFDKNNINVMLGDSVVAGFTAVEFRDNFNSKLVDKSGIKKTNRIYKITYTLTKNDNPAFPKQPLKIHMSLPATYQNVGLFTENEGDFQKVNIQKGGEWMEFSTLANNEVFYMVVYDTALGKEASLLWLYITAPTLGVILLGAGIFSFFTKRRKKEDKKNSDEDKDSSASPLETSTKTHPNNKSKKKIKKQKSNK